MIKSLKDITVLYVDDELINLELFAMTFKRYFKVITSISGSEGLSILDKTEKIDAVISDLKMPQISGLEFIQQAYQKNSSIIYYILTGYCIDEEIRQEINKGVVKSYLQKPFKKAEIIEMLKEDFGIT